MPEGDFHFQMPEEGLGEAHESSLLSCTGKTLSLFLNYLPWLAERSTEWSLEIKMRARRFKVIMRMLPGPHHSSASPSSELPHPPALGRNNIPPGAIMYSDNSTMASKRRNLGVFNCMFASERGYYGYVETAMETTLPLELSLETPSYSCPEFFLLFSFGSCVESVFGCSRSFEDKTSEKG